MYILRNKFLNIIAIKWNKTWCFNSWLRLVPTSSIESTVSWQHKFNDVQLCLFRILAPIFIVFKQNDEKWDYDAKEHNTR